MGQEGLQRSGTPARRAWSKGDSVAGNLRSGALGWRRVGRLVLVATLSLPLSGCYLYSFFKRDRHDGSGEQGATVFTGTVLGQPIGEKAGGPNEAALASVYAVATTHKPAPIRPDPDLLVRRLLREYRPEGATMARQIGQVEQFRLLLGGASQDFATAPQETYDATSLLAVAKVAEEACRALVAPSAWEHPGWSTILPYAPDDERANVVWLTQRVTGKTASQIDDTQVSDLLAIMASEKAQNSSSRTQGGAFDKYISVCTALALDANALYL